MAGSEAYIPLILRRKTVEHLLQALLLKCPGFHVQTVVGIYKKNCKGLLFVLDDDMMEYMEPQQIYDIELTMRSDEKYDMTLCEVKP